MLKQHGHIWDSGAVPDGSTISISAVSLTASALNRGVDILLMGPK